MKIAPAAIEGFLRAPKPEARAILLYGPDQGLVAERMDLLTRGVVEDPRDPFRVVDLTAEHLRDDPARLFDETAALSLMGGRPVVRLRDLGNVQSKLLGDWLDDGRGDALVLVTAGDLPPASSLRKLFEGAKTAAALPCYVDREQDLKRVIEAALQAEGLAVAPDAARFLTDALVGDRQMARREIEKLALYMAADDDGLTPRRVELADARACIGDNAAMDADDAALACASGNLPRMQRALRRLYGEGESPVRVLRAATRHFMRLHQAKLAVESGASPRAAVDALRPQVFFGHKDAVTRQVDRWPRARLEDALLRLAATEAACKRTGAPDLALASHALTALGYVARAARVTG